MSWLTATSIDELPKIASTILPMLIKHRVLALYGGMGAGKTTLVAEIAKQLKVEASTSSPSYAIHHQYPIKEGILHHFDFYRINSIAEAYDLGAEDLFFSGDLCLIEWPEQVEALFPEHTLRVEISVNEQNHRIFKLLI